MRVSLCVVIGLIIMFQAPVFGVTTTFHQIDSDTFNFTIERDDETINYTVDNCTGIMPCLTIDYNGSYSWNPSTGGIYTYLNDTLYYPWSGAPFQKIQRGIYVDGETVTFDINMTDGTHYILVNQTVLFDNDVFTMIFEEIGNSGEATTYSSKFEFNRSYNIPSGTSQVMISDQYDNSRIYSQNVVYMNNSGGQYYSMYFDWQTSNGSLLHYEDTCTAQSATSYYCFDISEYIAKTDGSYNPIYEEIRFAMSKDIWNVINMTANMDNPISPYYDELAETVILDCGGNSFDDAMSIFSNYFDYGFSDTLFLRRSWQKCGYDYCYPEFIPADEVNNYGGEAKLIELSAVVRDRNIRFGLHEQYIDFFNTSVDWNESDLTLNSTGDTIPGFDGAEGRFSWIMKETKVLKYAQRYSPNITEDYNTNAMFLDVHTHVYPHDNLDFDNDSDNSAMARTKLEEYADLMEYLKTTHGGPVMGEGGQKYDTYWTGYVDGIESQMVISNGNESNALVDYHLLNVHPYSVSHGVGYWNRFFRTGYPYTAAQNQEYIATTILWGNTGFLKTNGYPLTFEEELVNYYVLRSVQVQYANISVESIEYPNTTSSATMVDLSDAYRHGNTFSQVHINYTNDFEVFVNKNATVWTVNCGGTNYDLPFAGWCGNNPSEGFTGYYATVGGQNITHIESSEFEVDIKHHLGEINVTNKIDGSMIYRNFNGTSKNYTFDTTYRVYDSVSNTIISDTYPGGVATVSDDGGVRIYNMTDSTFYINMSGDYSSLEDSGNLMDVFDDIEDMQGLTEDNDIVLRDSGRVHVIDFTTTARNMIMIGSEDQTMAYGDNVTFALSS